jgi:hypothetical protein
MKKKTIKAIQELDKLTPAEKAVAFSMGVAYLPFGIVLQMAKDMNKPKRRKTGGRGHGKKDYWPYK